MSLEKALKEVDKEISRVLAEKETWMHKLFKDSRINEGKKLRARIFFAFSGNNTEESIKLASILEIFHAASLIHDDIIDNASLRRGKAPLYRKDGAITGLLYGDWLFANGFSQLAKFNNPEIYREITEALAKTLAGELHQRYRRNCLSLDEQEYVSIIRDKSGSLFAAACKTGALINGLEKKYAERAYSFGLNVGIAYQILDDTSDYLNLGKDKQAFKDLEESVVTLPLIYLLKRCSVKEKAGIKKIFQKDKMSREDAKRILFFMKKHNAIEDSLKKAKDFFYKAAGASKGNLNCSMEEPFDVLSWIGAKIDEAKKACCENCG
ncbi:MAG: polyprenyl synthetase family protein [Candidatus Omnitrophica bacterium]|nr:polyprenyl synthetase family protein [Candidatus Omnitrophota bacterium]